DNMKIVVAKRYGPGDRLHHWVHALCMSLFIYSGMVLYLDDFVFFKRSFISKFHLGLGIFIGAWDFVYYFLFLLLYDRHIKHMIPTPTDIRDLFIIVLCTLGFLADDKYPEHNFYDEDRGIYIKKFHPGQKLLYSADLLVMLLMGSTGLELAGKDAGILSFLTSINEPIYFGMDFVFGMTGGTAIRTAHFLMFVYFTCTTLLHAYMAVLPQNFSNVRGMLLGIEKIKYQESDEVSK
ncbi:MAG: cytochrome b/b6 domain-containing protein, partial [Promethearchaeota archaeon]